MNIDDLKLEREQYGTLAEASNSSPTETEKKMSAVSADKIKQPTLSNTSSSGSSVWTYIPGYQTLTDFIFGKPKDKPNPPPSEKPSQPSVDFHDIFAQLEAEMHSPMGITWKPTAKLGTLPPLDKMCPNLAAYARDLTQEALEGKLQPFVGREKEMEQTAEILIRNQKSNPLLLGPPGVGKSAFPSGIAQAIIKDQDDLPPVFKGKRLFFLQWERLVAGAQKYSGDTLEKRLSGVIAEAIANKEQVILFIDEIHAFLKDDKQSMAILKPALADGTISCIAATTPWDYKQMLEVDPALQRRFPIVTFSEPSENDTLQILKAYILKLEAHHGIGISDEALKECLELSERFLRSESFPDKAIDLLDQAASSLSLSKSTDAKTIKKDKQLALYLDRLIFMRKGAEDPSLIDQKIREIRSRFSRSVEPNHIREVLSRKIDIPLQKLQETEKSQLGNLEKLLAQKIVGQTQPIESLSQAVRRGRLRLGNQERPAGVFLMLGPTGVGKTACATALGQTMYGTNENVLRIDMSEYQQSHEISKLIGAPPGYLGHGKSGILTEWLRKKPNSVVIFDEIEKANSAVFDLLLQVFDAGRITDGNNSTIRCLDTIFIMTSNIGAKEILANYGKIPDQNLLKLVEDKIDKKFRPEFINRIQETVIFHPLTQDQIQQITRLQCNELKARVEKNVQCPNLTMEWDESLIQLLARKGFNETKGARELSRLMTRRMENPLADMIIRDKIVAGDRILFTALNDEVQIQVNGKTI